MHGRIMRLRAGDRFAARIQLPMRVMRQDGRDERQADRDLPRRRWGQTEIEVRLEAESVWLKLSRKKLEETGENWENWGQMGYLLVRMALRLHTSQATTIFGVLASTSFINQRGLGVRLGLVLPPSCAMVSALVSYAHGERPFVDIFIFFLKRERFISRHHGRGFGSRPLLGAKRDLALPRMRRHLIDCPAIHFPLEQYCALFIWYLASSAPVGNRLFELFSWFRGQILPSRSCHRSRTPE